MYLVYTKALILRSLIEVCFISSPHSRARRTACLLIRSKFHLIQCGVEMLKRYRFDSFLVTSRLTTIQGCISALDIVSHFTVVIWILKLGRNSCSYPLPAWAIRGTERSYPATRHCNNFLHGANIPGTKYLSVRVL